MVMQMKRRATGSDSKSCIGLRQQLMFIERLTERKLQNEQPHNHELHRRRADLMNRSQFSKKEHTMGAAVTFNLGRGGADVG